MTTVDTKILEITEFGPLVETSDGSLTIKHMGHGQDFHSSEGAHFEAWELYVVASGLKLDLETPGHDLRVLDVGMGLAYNAVATIVCWLRSDGFRNLDVVSLEVDERLAAALLNGRAPWCRNWSSDWLSVVRHIKKINHNEFIATLNHHRSRVLARWRIVIGDASISNLKTAIGVSMPEVDYIWQDPFTPELNPEMWSDEWFARLLGCASSRAKLMTYSVSRSVKEALTAGGWHYHRFRTPGRKRHWLQATPAQFKTD
jgi:tRNA U34 5-methylaminomethyl-2-thiouridine-forming methyltransferase MnmC